MKKYLISLDKDHHRRELFFAQPNTEDFEIFSAFNTMNENLEALNKRFNLAKFLQTYGREATKGEVGCTLSHLAVYQKIVENVEINDEEYSLVCEDDALFNDNFTDNLSLLLKQKPNCDILLIGQSKINHFNDIELEINYPTTFSWLQTKIKDCALSISYPYKNYFAGTVAYLIKKNTARKILEIVQKNNLAYWLADDFILFGSVFDLDIKIVRPLMVIENPELNSNLATDRSAVQHHFIKKLAKYPAKKFLAIKRNWGK